VREDVLERHATFEHARTVYGVVFNDARLNDALAVDVEATHKQRAALRAARLRAH